MNSLQLVSENNTELSSSNPPLSSSIDGVSLYAQQCASCHGELTKSLKQGRSPAQIMNAIANITEMSYLRLSAEQVDAISKALSSSTVAPGAGQIPTLPIGGVRVAVNSSELNRPTAFSNTRIRRLTRSEIFYALTDVFNVSASTLLSKLPTDVIQEDLNPFDNDSALQSISSTVVESFTDFAEQYSALLTNTQIDALSGCRPTSASDVTCFNQFASKIGRLLLRRPVKSTELVLYKALLDRAVAENNFYLGPRLLVQALLQHPEFLYRIEIGVAVAGTTYKSLTDYEIASRLSFLIWGSVPDDALLTAAANGQLKVEATRLQQVDRMWASAKATRQWQRFHAQWLGYDKVSLPANLTADMNQETDKLIERIAMGNSVYSWMELFSHTETYLTPALARHYDLSPVAAPTWVTYTGGRGGGILSHGQFLAQGSKFGDTSPTLRGYRILKRALCQKMGPIPIGVDTDSPPTGPVNACKTSTYSMRMQTSCTACHALTDNIGFGLENLSATGQWRAFEVGKPNCQITGEGSVGEEFFSGPAELGANLAQNPVVVQCAMRQLLRFSLGRADQSTDQNLIEAMHSEFLKSQKLKSILAALVKSPAFINK